MAERIFIFVGKTALFWSGAALVYVGWTNPMNTHLFWARTYVFVGLLITTFGHRMSDNISSFFGKVAVFCGGIALFFVNYHMAKSVLQSFACLIAGLAMVSISGGYLMYAAKNDGRPKPPKRPLIMLS